MCVLSSLTRNGACDCERRRRSNEASVNIGTAVHCLDSLTIWSYLIHVCLFLFSVRIFIRLTNELACSCDLTAEPQERRREEMQRKNNNKRMAKTETDRREWERENVYVN